MPRRGIVIKREIAPDSKYNGVLVAKFINCLMKKGKKSLAERIFYNAVEEIERKTGQDGLAIFHQAVENVKPVLEVKPRRVGGATYQVPVEVRPERRTSLSIRWLISYARLRPEPTMWERLANELISAAKAEGAAVKKREDTHKMAEANKAFAHYRW